jgi:thioesterase domain-containing protein/acyl carrier protein
MFLFVEEFPRTVSGKIDRQALSSVTHGSGASRSSAIPTPAPLTSVEQALSEMWCKLLGIGQVRADDSFFDLGGDSLKASALMARIEERFNHRLPLSLLLQHETLRGLAGAITAGDPSLSGGLLVTIQPLGHKPPVFFISGIGGEVVALHDLVANLGYDRPLYGLQGVNFGDSARNFKTIEQAAEEYGDAVRAVQPHGPYNLAGYSFGGHLALEIARRLAVPGQSEPPKVLLIDTYPPVPRRNASLAKRVRIHYTNLRQLNNAPEIAGYVRDRLQRVYLRLIRLPSTRAIAQKLNAPDSSPTATAHFALAAYKPQPYTGKVVLFKAAQREWYEEWDPMAAWQEFISGEIQVGIVPGEHKNLVKNPYAIELARQLKETLA